MSKKNKKNNNKFVKKDESKKVESELKVENVQTETSKVEQKEVNESKAENNKKEEKKSHCDEKCCKEGFLKFKDFLFPVLLILVLVAILVGVFVYKGKIWKKDNSVVSDSVKKEIQDKMKDPFEKKFLSGTKFEYKDITDESGLYKLSLKVNDKDDVTVYLTKDFAMLIPDPSYGIPAVDLKKVFGELNEKPVSLDELLNNTAKELNINEDNFKKCISEKRYEKKVNDYIQEGAKAGVTGTPHSVIVANGVQYELSGAQEAETIKANLDKALAGNLDLEKSKNVAKAVDISDHIRGNKNSNVAYIEYSDVDCPYCKKLHETMEGVVQEYGDRVKFVFRPFPLDMHPNSKAKTEATECANELGGEEAYWKYLDKMFKSK